MKLTNILFSITLSVLISACHNSPTSPITVPNTGTLYPLNVGNYWKYKITVYDSIDFQIQFTEQVDSIGTDSIINGNKWFSITTVTNSNRPGYNGINLYLNTGNGFYEYFVWAPGNDSELIYKYPCQVGDVYKEYSISSNPVKVINMQSVVISQAGKFNCIIYEFQYESAVGSVYDDVSVAIGIGKIREEYFFYDSSMERVNIYTSDLYSYKIN
jgi:hypothetical protein